MSLISDYMEQVMIEHVFRDDLFGVPVSLSTGVAVVKTDIGTYLQQIETWLNNDLAMVGSETPSEFVARIGKQFVAENHPLANHFAEITILVDHVNAGGYLVDYGPFLGAAEVADLNEANYRPMQEARRRLVEIRRSTPATMPAHGDNRYEPAAVTHGPYGPPIGVLKRPKPTQPVVKEPEMPNRRTIILE